MEPVGSSLNLREPLPTRLTAEITDFALQERMTEDGRRDDAFYVFRFGQCEDFDEALDAFKARIPRTERTPDPGRGWVWTVLATLANRRAMLELFDNFSACYEAAKAQLRMSL